ncbi:MAG: FliG C-terminal domain-containing protein, partial [Paracoccaceae bacterium]
AEGTEVAAVLLSKLTTAKAAEIISSLPGEQARRIACAVSMTGQVAPETVARIGHTLLDQLEIAPKTAFSEPAAARMGAILNVSPAATRNEVLEGLDAVDTDFAAAVRKAIFTYADIPRRVTARDVPAITRAVAGDVLVTAMAGAEGTDAKATEFILSNMPRRMADQMREQIAERDKVRRGDAEAAMAEIVTVLRALAETGEITLDADEEEDAA